MEADIAETLHIDGTSEDGSGSADVATSSAPAPGRRRATTGETGEQGSTSGGDEGADER
jgi:hypothetical protein